MEEYTLNYSNDPRNDPRMALNSGLLEALGTNLTTHSKPALLSTQKEPQTPLKEPQDAVMVEAPTVPFGSFGHNYIL